MRRPRAVLLDADDTLLDNSGVAESVARAAQDIASAVDGLDAVKLLAANNEAWARYWPEVERSCWLGETEVSDVSREVWRRALAANGRTAETIVDLAVAVQQRRDREATRLFDDVPEFLAGLTNAGVLTAVVTNNSSQSQRKRLSTAGLDGLVDAVIISGELGVAKPAPEPFEEALNRLGVSAGQAWHVGDSLNTDVAGARGAGIFAVWLNRGGAVRPDDAPAADWEIRTLTEILHWIDQAE